jgi:hypothetical protein
MRSGPSSSDSSERSVVWETESAAGRGINGGQSEMPRWGINSDVRSRLVGTGTAQVPGLRGHTSTDTNSIIRSNRKTKPDDGNFGFLYRSECSTIVQSHHCAPNFTDVVETARTLRMLAFAQFAVVASIHEPHFRASSIIAPYSAPRRFFRTSLTVMLTQRTVRSRSRHHKHREYRIW